MKFKFRKYLPLFKLMWQSSKRDIVVAVPWFPLYSIAEVLLAIGSAVLLQLLFAKNAVLQVQDIVPGKFKDFFGSTLTIDRNEMIYVVPTFIAIVAFVKFISRFLSTYLTERAGHRMACDLREKMLENFVSSNGNTIDKINPDHIANQIIQDSTLLQTALNKGTISAVRDTVVLIFIVSSLLLISWKIFFIGIAIVVPMVLLLKKTAGRLNFYTREGQKKSIDISTRFLQTFQGLLGIHVLRSHGRELSDLNDLNETNYQFLRKSLFVKTFFSPAMEFVGIVLLAGVFFWRLNTDINFEAVNYSAMIILVLFSFRYIKNIANTITFFSDMQVVFERVTQYFNDYKPSEKSEYFKTLPNYSKEAVIAKNISYTVEQNRKILDNCSVSILKGKKIAFVGESGSGKTTFLRTLGGLIHPSEGHVSMCASYLMAFQSPYIYRGTTQENIIYNQKVKSTHIANKKCEDLIRALHLAFTDSGTQIFLNKQLNFLGEGLSGGEKARVALARILFASPQLILLDEPTANLDAASSRFFWQAIEKWQEQDSENTIIAVSHLMREIIDFDYCYVFENGKIVKEGIPREIL